MDATTLTPPAVRGGMPPWLTLLLGTACGLLVANIYYAQPLIGLISASLGMSPHAAGLIVTMSQVGYGAGLLLVVPLGDLVENRRLVLAILGGSVLALLAAATSTHAGTFLPAMLLTGMGSVAAQVLVPYAATLAPEAQRGRVVGNVMSGLLIGIMLARPAASLIADASSWHAVFYVSAVLMAGLGVVLRFALPVRRPAPGLGYGALLASMGRLALETPVLQRRALYQAWLFGAFSLFWTAVPLLLTDVFHLSQRGIALFALVGVAGAIAAPITGRVVDRGLGRPAGMLAMLAVAGSLLLAQVARSGGWAELLALMVAAVVLDFGVTANFTLGQRAIFSLGAAARSRLNGLYIAALFVGGAAGSALGGWSYAQGGWPLAMGVAMVAPVVAFVAYWRGMRSR